MLTEKLLERHEEAEHLVALRKEMAKLPASASQEADYDTDDIPYM